MSYAVTVLSGGMDSTVLAHLSNGLNDRVDLVSVDLVSDERGEVSWQASTRSYWWEIWEPTPKSGGCRLAIPGAIQYSDGSTPVSEP